MSDKNSPENSDDDRAQLSVSRRNILKFTGVSTFSPAAYVATASAQTGPAVNIRQVNRPDFPEVTVFATVKDSAGSSLTNLSKSDFTLTETRLGTSSTQAIDSFSQPTEDIAGNIATSIVIDQSGSMDTGSRMQNAIQGGKEFVQQFEPGDQGLLVAFDGVVNIPQRWTETQSDLTDAIDALSPGGSTALYDAAKKGIEEAATRTDRPSIGRSAIVVLSDGGDNASSASETEVIDTANQQNIPIYTIGLGSTVDAATLEQLATKTGGEYYYSAGGSDLADIYNEISDSITSEYEITYITNDNTTDGEQREIRLETSYNGETAFDTETYEEPCAPLPTASFDLSTDTAVEGQEVSFDGTASQPNGGTLVSYEWDFNNDGQIDSTGETATNTYAQPGQYDIALTVEKTCGARDVEVKSLVVADEPVSVVNIDTNSPIQVGETLKVELELKNAEFDKENRSVILQDFDGNTADAQAVQVGRGETLNITLEWDTEVGDSGTDDITVRVSDIAVNEEITIEETTIPSPEITQTRGGTTDNVPITISPVNSPITFQVTEPEPHENLTYHWKIVNKPRGSEPGLLHGDGEHSEVDSNSSNTKRHAALHPDEKGQYTIKVGIKENGEIIRQGTKDVKVENKGLTGLDDIDFTPPRGDTVAELAEAYAPVLHFHQDEKFFPTRLEALIENSELHLSRDNAESGSNPVLEEPSLIDLGNERTDKSYELDDKTNVLYLTGDENEYRKYQSQYPNTVYASVTSTTDSGTPPKIPEENYIALTYWVFYLFDPKDGKDNNVPDQIKSLTLSHASDTETVTLLINKDGPQWIAASQHYSGEYLDWNKYTEWVERSEDQTNNQINIFPAKGAHSSFLVNTQEYDGGIPAQGRWLPWLNGTASSKISGLSILNNTLADTADTLSNTFDDETGSDQRWAFDSTEDHSYSLLILPDEDKANWTQFAGTFTSEEVTNTVSEKELVPEVIKKIETGKLPWSSDLFDDPIAEIDSRMLPEQDVLTANKIIDNSFIDGLQSYFSRDGSLGLGKVTSFNIFYWENPGAKPHEFVLEYEIKTDDGSIDVSDQQYLSLGWNSIENIEILLSKYNLPSDTDVTVEASIYAHNPSTYQNISEGKIYTTTEKTTVERSINLSLNSTSTVTKNMAPSSIVAPGDEVSGSVTVTNTSKKGHTFFFSLTPIGEDGRRYNPNETIGKPVTVAGGEQRTIDISWIINDEIPEGEYDIKIEGWYESDPENLTDRLVSQTEENAFTVSKPEGTLNVTTTPSNALVTVRDQITDDAPLTATLPVGTYAISVLAEGYEGAKETIQIKEGEETTVSLDLTESSGPTLWYESYINENNVVDNSGLNSAIGDSLRGDLSDSKLNTVISSYLSGNPIS